MTNIQVKLASNLIVREEADGYLLYNRTNDAVIKLLPLVYKQLVAGMVPNTEKYKKLLKILTQNKMLQNNEMALGASVASSNLSGSLANIFGITSTHNPINILWAITSQCNLRCIYCFPNVQAIAPRHRSLQLSGLNNIADQLIAAKVFQVTFSGGEALLEPNLWAIVHKLSQNMIKIVVITNGTVVNAEIIERLLQYQIIVAVSLDAADETVNALTRGSGVWSRTIAGIKQIVTAKIPLVILVTITKHNFPCLVELIKFISNNLQVQQITLQDLRPFGTKQEYQQHRLTIAQEAQLPEVLATLVKLFPHVYFNYTELLNFPRDQHSSVKNGKLMQCPAGNNIAYIDFYGDMYPCTHLPTMRVGNLLRDGTITELWQKSAVMSQLRQLKTEALAKIKECQDCTLNIYCDGGCRGDALFYKNDLYALASRCPREMGLPPLVI